MPINISKNVCVQEILFLLQNYFGILKGDERLGGQREKVAHVGWEIGGWEFKRQMTEMVG